MANYVSTALRGSTVARDGVLGGAIGLLVASILITANLDMREGLEHSGAPLTSLAGLIGALVLQFVIVAGACGAALRSFVEYD